MEAPLVSAIMIMHNGEKYLREAIDSILGQTYKNLELILINDGSTDHSREIIESYSDKRIIAVHTAVNSGIVTARNQAVSLANGKYIAIIDCDDIALPQRFEKQVEFLQNNPEFGILGSSVQVIDEEGRPKNNPVTYPATPPEIPVILLFRNYFTNSAVMMRRSCFPKEGYRSEFPVAEDYDLWVRMIRSCKAWNLQETLTLYRLHSTNVSKEKAQLMLEIDRKILAMQLKEIGADLTDKEFELLFQTGKEDFIAYFNNILFVDNTFAKLYSANMRTKVLDPEELKKFLFNCWKKAWPDIQKYNLRLLFNLHLSPLFSMLDLKTRLKFITKCILHYNV